MTRRQVLAGADGVVLVADSSPEMEQANVWALENLGQNLKRNGLDPETTPVVLQWNKRDLPDLIPVASLQAILNREGRPAHESVATTGAGVVETFASVVKGAIQAAYTKAGKRPVPGEDLDTMLASALGEARSSAAPLPEAGPMGFDHRFDSDSYRDDWADKGRDRQILDQGTLLGSPWKFIFADL